MKRLCYILMGVAVWYGFSRFSWLCLYAVCHIILEGKNETQITSMTTGYMILTGAMLLYFLVDTMKGPLPKKAPQKPIQPLPHYIPPEKKSAPEQTTVDNQPHKPFENPLQKSSAPQKEEAQNQGQATLVKLNHKEFVSSTSFADIAGYATTKANLQFMVSCMKNPAQLREAGAKIPKGVIFYGPPGTGKTLMASAVAGTAGVHFLTINASAFINTYVGTGAQAVRALYEDARSLAPCVVFIDELDAIGGKRSGDQHQEYRNTINALLSELDGMATKAGILTIAATNTVEMLDEALVRPGRFDRKVMIPLPDEQDRLAILKIHAKTKKLAQDVDLNALAHSTEGLSGAALATVLNEAALMGVAEGTVLTTKKNLDKAILQYLTAGEETDAQTGDMGRLVAWHEAGHALCRKLLCGGTVPQVTIKGSSSGALGLTISGSNGGHTRKTMKAELKTLYGGRVAELLCCGNPEDVTAGASQDIQQASRLLKEYIQLFGLGDGSCLLDARVLWGEQVSHGDKAAVSQFATTLYEETEAFLRTELLLLEKTAQALLERKSLDDEDLNRLIALYRKETTYA